MSNSSLPPLWLAAGLGNEAPLGRYEETQVEARRRIESERRAGRAVEAGNHGGAVGLAREIDPDAAGRRKLRIHGESEQSLLAVWGHVSREVQDRVGLQYAVDDQANAAGLLDHELPMVVRGIGDQSNG